MSYVSDYDFEMRELARGAEALHRRLKEVYFINSNNDSILIFEDGTYLPTQHRKYGYYIQREQYSFKVAANLGGTDPFTLLTFGYSGTGPRCYADFLLACGFSGAYYEVIKVLSPPVKLKRDGSQVKGKYREAQSQIVASGKTLEEARQNLAKEQEQKQEKIKVRLPAESCLLAEEVLCDGELVKTITEVIAGSEEEAEKKALKEIPYDAKVLNISRKEAVESSIIKAFDAGEAAKKATNQIESYENTYKSLLEIICLVSPIKGFLGIGRKTGEYEARYRILTMAVESSHQPLARVRLRFGPKKLLCNQCAELMTTSTEGVHYVGSPPNLESEIIKLRCEKCDLTRLEKRWEIEGKWIEWEDGGLFFLHN